MKEISFDFENVGVETPSFLNDLEQVDVLWRLAQKGTRQFYLVDYSRDDKVSLFKLHQDFIERNTNLCDSDCFLGFMFFIVYGKPPSEEKMLEKWAVQLLKERLVILVESNKTFREKIAYIRATPIIKPGYKQASHWDMKYINDKYCEDDDIIELLYSCSEIFNITENLRKKTDLVV